MSSQWTDIERLVSLALGELDAAEAAALRARVDREPELRATFARLAAAAGFLRDEAGAAPSNEALRRAKRLLREARPSALERLDDGLRRLIAALDFDTRLTPAVAGIRGGAGTAQVAFSSDAADIDLEIAPSGDGLWRLVAQIDADEDGDWEITVVDRATDVAVQELLARDGAFRIELGAGTYTLRLRRDNLEIEVGPVQIP